MEPWTVPHPPIVDTIHSSIFFISLQFSNLFLTNFLTTISTPLTQESRQIKPVTILLTKYNY